VGVERVVDGLHVRGHRSLELGAPGGVTRFLDALGVQHRQRQRLTEVGAGHAAGLDSRVHDQLVLDRRRRHVLALAGLEQVLHAAGDAQVALGVECALVAGAQPAVCGEGLARQFGFLVIAQHRARRLDLDLARHRVEPALHAVIRQAHRARALLAGQGGVADAAVLGHAVDLDQVKLELVVPAQQFGRHRRGAAGGEYAFLQAQGGKHLLAHDAAEDGDLQHAVQLGRRHLGVDALLELHPQARHAEEHRRPGTLQVGGEGFQALGKVDVHAGGQQPVFDQHALGNVAQRQVAQHAGAVVDGRHPLQARLHAPGEGGKAVHHALGRAGGARGVHDGRQFVGRAHGLTLQRRRAGGDVFPARIGPGCIFRRQRQADARHRGRDAGLHALPAVELADEQQLGLAVFEDLADGARCQRGVQRHRNEAADPDREIRHQPVGRVLGQQRHLVAGLQTQRLQVGGHAPALVHHLAPGVFTNLPRTGGLGEDDTVGLGPFPVVQTLQGQCVG